MSDLDELKRLQEAYPDMSGHAFYSAEFTDRYRVGRWDADTIDRLNQEETRNGSAVCDLLMRDCLLSIRIFNEDREVRLSRDHIGAAAFIWNDEHDDTEELRKVNNRHPWMDEWQLLDVDTAWMGRHPDRNVYRTTGGGMYSFPLPQPGKDQHPAVLIRHYLSSKTEDGESGQTYVCGWRCVRFAMVKWDAQKGELKEDQGYGR